jgi:hypothetical protein
VLVLVSELLLFVSAWASKQVSLLTVSFAVVSGASVRSHQNALALVGRTLANQFGIAFASDVAGIWHDERGGGSQNSGQVRVEGGGA